MQDYRQGRWLLVLPTDSVQGSEQIVLNFARFLHKRGYPCEIWILTRKKSLGWIQHEKDFTIRYFPHSHYIAGLFAMGLRLMLTHPRRFSFTFSSQTLINGSLGICRRLGCLRGARIIVRESNSIFQLLKGAKLGVYKAFYQLGYPKVTLVITQTELMKAQLEAALPRLTRKLQLVCLPNPVNFDDIEIKSAETRPDLTSRSFLVAAGRLAPVKGFDILLNSFARIAPDYPGLELIILGEGGQRAALTAQIKNLKLENRVEMPGYVQNVYPYFRSARVCVISSRLEGFPNVLLQMMTQNGHVVSTLSAGGIETIPGLVTCAPEDETELEQAIRQSLEDPIDHRPEFTNYLSSRTWESFYIGIMEHLYT